MDNCILSATDPRCELSAVIVHFFPKIMQLLLKGMINPKCLKNKFNSDRKVVFNKDEISLMSKLPRIEDFTVSLCYKLLRYENLIEEPKCKWGNIPDDTHMEISDDVLRLLHIRNELITKLQGGITNDYYMETKRNIESIICRVDRYLESDNNECLELYRSVCKSKDNVSSCVEILQNLPIVQVISTISLDTIKNQMRERCARLYVMVIDVLPEILRLIIIKSNISAVDMYKKCIAIPNKFDDFQRANLLLLHSTNTYNSLDIPLLCKLIRFFFLALNIQPPAQGWWKEPHPASQNLGDDIERIRILRNDLAHKSIVDINEVIFENYFKQIVSISRRIDIKFGTSFTQLIIERKTADMDINLQINYQRALRELENVQSRYEKKPVDFYWGDTFETNMRNIRSMLKDAAEEGKQKVRLKIVCNCDNDRDKAVRILNEMHEEINKGLSGIEFVYASTGSIELHVEILMELIVTDEELITHLYSLMKNVLQLGVLEISSNESVDVYLIFEEEYTEQSTMVFDTEETNDTSEIILDFDVEVGIFETEDTMKEKLGNAVKNVMQLANRNVENTEISATILSLKIEHTKQSAILHGRGERNDESMIDHNVDDIFDTEDKLNTSIASDFETVMQYDVKGEETEMFATVPHLQLEYTKQSAILLRRGERNDESMIDHNVDDIFDTVDKLNTYIGSDLKTVMQSYVKGEETEMFATVSQLQLDKEHDDAKEIPDFNDSQSRSNNDYTNRSNSEGKYAEKGKHVDIRNTMENNKTSRSIGENNTFQEEDNYVRMNLLLLKVCPRAVRRLFDSEFYPSLLEETIKKTYSKIKDLKTKRIINQGQWNLLFPFNGSPDSNMFDVPLMIALLTNLDKMNHYDKLPLITDTTPSADLGRIKYYRNLILHTKDETVDNLFFSTAWEDIIEAVGRLGGQNMLDECKELRTKILEESTVPWNIRDHICEVNELKKNNTESECMRLQMATISQIEEKYARMSLLLYSITPRAVRVLFDKEFDPSTLDSAIKRAYHSLLDMRNNRIISKPQWDLLFISVGGPDSKTFDITLMISLLTNLTKLTKYNDELPFATDFSPSADLARIKYYRNQLSHNKDGTMNSRLFNAAWGDISGAVGRLGGRDLLDECTQMKTRTLEQSTVPWNRRVQIKKTLEKWKTNDSSFIETEGAKAVLKCVKENSCVTITASSGVGKTSTLRHVVLQMEDEGYTILPITNPHDIQVFYNPNQKSVFVIDDFCGTYSINQTSFDNWKTAIGDIKEVIEDKVTKIVVACRLQVYQENKFKSLSIFRTCVCNMLSEDFCLSRSEKLSIAELYMDKKSSDIIQYCDLYDFFPLLCKLYNDNTFQNVKDFFQHPFAVIEAEIEKLLESEDYGKYCVLVLCVMFNNVLIENWFTEEIDNETKMIIGNTCEACRLPVGTSRLVLLDQINVLQYTFIKKEYGVYRTVHDKIFDFLASYFGKKMINCLIRNAYNRVIMERFLLDKNNHEDQNITLVPPKYHDLYVVRMITDWSKGQPSCVFNNINMKIPKFRLWLLNHLKTQAVSFQKKLAHASCKTYRESVLVYCCYFDDCIPWIMWCLDLGVDVNQCDFVDVSPLSISAQEGHIEVVKVLLENKADINKCDINGASPLFFACEENHLDIVKVLLDKKADINMSTHDTSFYSSYVRGKDYVKRKHAGESPLFIACHENHIEIVKVLLSHRADVNKQRDDGLSPLSIACQRNHIEIVELLLNKKADIKKCAGMKLCPCCIACLQNHVEIVKVLLDNKVDINKCETGKASHLLIACQKNRIEMVKVLLDNKANVNRCTDEGVSPLFIACQMNHIEIVQALIDKNADINRCAPMNTSPLYTACHQNHKEIVKLLLDNKADINKCVNNFFSPLFIACENFHIEIVKLLLDDKADIHELETYPLFSIKKK